MALSSLELKEEIDLAGVWVSTKPFSLDSDRGRQRPFLCPAGSKQKSPRGGEDEW